ncbi:hypothetical protein V6U90_29265, partial [Micromonospora sp. CPCC 206060]|uniref:hypothetical protein n=1 Tax=Micromonospora sp. CPCC 206060 TaxID=3122406 RepID=UPI002FF3D8E3
MTTTRFGGADADVTLPPLSRWSDRVLADRVHRTLYTDPAIFESNARNLWMSAVGAYPPGESKS